MKKLFLIISLLGINFGAIAAQGGDPRAVAQAIVSDMVTKMRALQILQDDHRMTSNEDLARRELILIANEVKQLASWVKDNTETSRNYIDRYGPEMINGNDREGGIFQRLNSAQHFISQSRTGPINEQLRDIRRQLNLQARTICQLALPRIRLPDEGFSEE